MDINGLRTTLIENLMVDRKLTNVADVYRLTINDLVDLEKFGTKSALKILNNIDESKNRPFCRLLHDLGILGINEQTARILTNNFRSMDRMIAAKRAEFEKLNGIETKLSSAIIAFFHKQYNMKVIRNVQMLGVSCEYHDHKDTHNGNIGIYDTPRSTQKIENLGGNVLSSISKNHSHCWRK
jgi:DNA ligase (NAD+)